MNEGPEHRAGSYVPPGPRRRRCSAGLSLLHHKVEAAQPLSGSQLSDLQAGKQGRKMQPGGRRDGSTDRRHSWG